MLWFKLFSEWGSDPKVQSMSEAMQRRLVMLYCLRCHGDLSRLTEREIALGLRIPLRALRETHATFVEKGFIRDDWTMPKWEARQAPIDPGAAQRMRDYRKRLAERPDHVRRNGQSRPIDRDDSKGREETRREEEEEERMTGGGARPPERSPSRTGPDRPPDPAPADPAGVATPPADPEAMDVARFAADLGGPDWSDWVLRMAHAGHRAAWVKEAMLTARKRGHFRRPYADAILESYAAQGGPDRADKSAPADVPRTGGPKSLAEIGPPPFIPEGPAGDAIRRMYPPKEDAP